MVTNDISDVAIASVHSEKTRLKKMIMIIIIIMNLSQEMTVFGERQKLTSAWGQKSDGRLKFDALYRHVSLHREPPEVGLVEKLTGSLYWWVEQKCQPYIESATALPDISQFSIEQTCECLTRFARSPTIYTESEQSSDCTNIRYSINKSYSTLEV